MKIAMIRVALPVPGFGGTSTFEASKGFALREVERGIEIERGGKLAVAAWANIAGWLYEPKGMRTLLEEENPRMAAMIPEDDPELAAKLATPAGRAEVRAGVDAVFEKVRRENSERAAREPAVEAPAPAEGERPAERPRRRARKKSSAAKSGGGSA